MKFSSSHLSHEILMAGHSRWTQIKRQKGVADVKRSALYTKLGHMIALAVRESGKDPSSNLRLRLALEKAKEANMPKATIERSVKRGSGEVGTKQTIDHVVYEGFGPGNIAIVIEAITDNKNRTAAEVRHAMHVLGGILGNAGSVQWMFEARGRIILTQMISEQEELKLIDVGADDILRNTENVILYCPTDQLERFRLAVVKLGFMVKNSEVVLIPKTTTEPATDDDAEKLGKLIDALESIDEVTNVITNAS